METILSLKDHKKAPTVEKKVDSKKPEKKRKLKSVYQSTICKSATRIEKLS